MPVTDKSCVWIVFTKCRLLPHCSINFGGGEYCFVEAFVPCHRQDDWRQLDDVFKRVNQRLIVADAVLVDIVKCMRYVADEWQTQSELNDELHVAAREALKSGDIVFGGFRSDEIEVEIECEYRHQYIELDRES